MMKQLNSLESYIMSEEERLTIQVPEVDIKIREGHAMEVVVHQLDHEEFDKLPSPEIMGETCSWKVVAGVTFFRKV